MNHCCSEFQAEVDQGVVFHIAPKPGETLRPGWCVSSAGAVEMDGMKFCPFCGHKLPTVEEDTK